MLKKISGWISRLFCRRNLGRFCDGIRGRMFNWIQAVIFEGMREEFSEAIQHFWFSETIAEQILKEYMEDIPRGRIYELILEKFSREILAEISGRIFGHLHRFRLLQWDDQSKLYLFSNFGFGRISWRNIQILCMKKSESISGKNLSESVEDS